jgi:hypothetical protein
MDANLVKVTGAAEPSGVSVLSNKGEFNQQQRSSTNYQSKKSTARKKHKKARRDKRKKR